MLCGALLSVGRRRLHDLKNIFRSFRQGVDKATISRLQPGEMESDIKQQNPLQGFNYAEDSAALWKYGVSKPLYSVLIEFALGHLHLCPNMTCFFIEILELF